MGTKIEWADSSWNPIKMRCTPVSEGCQNCYADRLLSRNLPGFASYPAIGEPPILDKHSLNLPAIWKKPRRIFVESMGDLFHDSVEWPMIDKVFWEAIKCQDHIFIILTKRPDTAWYYFNSPVDETNISRNEFLAENVWLGVTAENQRTADERIPILLQIPAAVRFVSVEPMLGPVDLNQNYNNGKHFGNMINWVICGAETGPKARPMNIMDALDLKKQCADADVPFFFKKWSKPQHPNVPNEDDMPREFPKVKED